VTLTRTLVDSAAHVFVADLSTPVLDDADAHHVFRVLRVRDGELVTCSDGVGRWRAFRVAGQQLTPDGEIADGPALRSITVACAIPKGDRPEQIVQQLSEIGVSRFVPLHTDHGVVRWSGDRGERHVERLRRVARESAMQSRRCTIMTIEPVVASHSALAWPQAVICVPGAAPTAAAVRTHDAPIVFIGPEGGWSAAEKSHAERSGATSVGLGPTILRIETAALVAALLFALS
jgi:16S rRNA (uracil1498-N3)-methyltransferase